jgi:hypothetical protein
MSNNRIELPTREQLRSVIAYDPDTGVFTRLHATSSQGPAGEIKGSIRRNNCGKAYRSFSVFGVSHSAHRLAFIYMTGEAPEQVDHENGNGLDNRWANLRASTNERNSKNQRLRKSNTSGQMGVSWHKKSRQWAIRINANGRRIYLGYRKSLGEAIAVRKSAELEYGYDPNHGLPRPIYDGRAESGEGAHV